MLTTTQMRGIKRIIALVVCVLPLFAMAEVWTAENFPMVHLQNARRYVCDPDNVLTPAVRDSIDALLFSLEQKRGVQSVFAVAKRIEGGEPYEFGMALARKHKVGQKKQNSGLIVVLSTEDRAYYILTGNGLEGTLPDGICRRIENRYMVPYLKSGNWDKAMLNSAKALYAYVAKDESLLPDNKKSDDSDAQIVGFFIFLVLAVMFFYFVARKKWNDDLCPNCKQHTLKRTSQMLRRTTDGKLLVIYKCSKCGHTIAKEQDENDHNSRGNGMSSLLPFIFLGGGGGRSSYGGGSGFSGGSFGGGSFGGGGAGGKF